MTLFYYDPVFMEHGTGDHPENPGRLLPTVRHLNFVGLDSMCTRPAWKPATEEQICLVHAPAYVASLRSFAEAGGGWLDEDTYLCERSYAVARLAAGAAIDAVQRVVAGEDTSAFCLVRPPGHHALADRAMGFCLLNNVAIAARFATSQLGVQRVMIVDFDAHHGNGTQAIFWEDAQVAYFSMHRASFYPYTGFGSEVGLAASKGTTCNIEVSLGTPRTELLERFQSELAKFSEAVRPELVIISAGFDAHRDDPLGSLGLLTEDFAVITQTIMDVARRHAGGRVVSVLEGGYNPDALSDCVAEHLETLLQAE
ncbi:MAG: histone deacetylase [Pirellulaceae bacterium]|nr:histone deacetylase [Pirellulaceae bacterium]